MVTDKFYHFKEIYYRFSYPIKLEDELSNLLMSLCFQGSIFKGLVSALNYTNKIKMLLVTIPGGFFLLGCAVSPGPSEDPGLRGPD